MSGPEPVRERAAGERPARWLVLGAAGFIGGAVLAELKSQSRIVLGVGHSAGPAVQAEVDAFDTEAVQRQLRDWPPEILIQAIGHPAGFPAASLEDFYGRSTARLLTAVQAVAPACRVILLGSAAEYGNSPEGTGSRENDPLRPLSDYGRAKCVQGSVASRFAAAGLSVVTARLFNPIGRGQSGRQLAGALCERIRRGERPLRVTGGCQVRDWIDIRDTARALVRLGEASEVPAVVNVCTGRGHTVAWVATELGRLADVPVLIEPGEISPNELGHSLGDPGRLQRLGWRPRHALAESLADLWLAA